MKLVICGANGYLGTELLRQSLRMPAVSTVVALARRPVSVPEGADGAKMRCVVVEDYGNFSADARKQLEGTDACIWYGKPSRRRADPTLLVPKRTTSC